MQSYTNQKDKNIGTVLHLTVTERAPTYIHRLFKFGKFNTMAFWLWVHWSNYVTLFVVNSHIIAIRVLRLVSKTMQTTGALLIGLHFLAGPQPEFPAPGQL